MSEFGGRASDVFYSLRRREAASFHPQNTLFFFLNLLFYLGGCGSGRESICNGELHISLLKGLEICKEPQLRCNCLCSRPTGSWKALFRMQMSSPLLHLTPLSHSFILIIESRRRRSASLRFCLERQNFPSVFFCCFFCHAHLTHTEKQTNGNIIAENLVLLGIITRSCIWRLNGKNGL